MKNESSSLQSVHILIAVVTLIFCLGVFHFVLPTFIQEKSDIVLAEHDESQEVANLNHDTELPQDLIDYVQQQRTEVATDSEDFNDDQLAYNTDDMQEDYFSKANQIISNRFKKSTFDEDVESGNFAIPDELKDIVQFWIHIFGHYTKDQVVFYNADNTGIVYSVLDFSETNFVNNDGVKSFRSQMIRDESLRLKKIIKKIAVQIKDNKVKISDFTPEEQHIAELLLKNNDNIDVSERGLLSSFKHRTGYANRIRKAYILSGLYMDEMKRIFRERGLPEELTTIPFIESAFNLNSYSHAGAAGIWQFIRETGRRYLKIDEYVDERYDPILSAYAAATHLSNEYALLKSWPLTVNAYNTGPGRMLQAIRQLNTRDIAKICKYFKGAGYGSDSRNYYPEFLAALYIINNSQEFFGDIETKPLQKFEYVVMPSPVNIKELSRLAGVKTSVILDYNLSLRPEVAAGYKKLPKGYLLKIPPDTKENIMIAMQDLQKEIRFATHHIVRRGESLDKIASMYDVPINELASLNQILPQQKLKRGSVIQLPNRDRYEYTQNSNELVVPDELNTPVF